MSPWWRRAVAIILDGVVVAIPLGILFSATGLYRFSAAPAAHAARAGVATFSGVKVSQWANLISIAVYLAYFAVLDGAPGGQTVGKRALGIATRDARTGGPVGIAGAFGRRFVYYGLFALFVVPGILNIVSPLWDRRGQAWHDKVARTVVVDLRA